MNFLDYTTRLDSETRKCHRAAQSTPRLGLESGRENRNIRVCITIQKGRSRQPGRFHISAWRLCQCGM